MKDGNGLTVSFTHDIWHEQAGQNILAGFMQVDSTIRHHLSLEVHQPVPRSTKAGTMAL